MGDTAITNPGINSAPTPEDYPSGNGGPGTTVTSPSGVTFRPIRAVSLGDALFAVESNVRDQQYKANKKVLDGLNATQAEASQGIKYEGDMQKLLKDAKDGDKIKVTPEMMDWIKSHLPPDQQPNWRIYMGKIGNTEWDVSPEDAEKLVKMGEESGYRLDTSTMYLFVKKEDMDTLLTSLQKWDSNKSQGQQEELMIAQNYSDMVDATTSGMGKISQGDNQMWGSFLS